MANKIEKLAIQPPLKTAIQTPASMDAEAHICRGGAHFKISFKTSISATFCLNSLLSCMRRVDSFLLIPRNCDLTETDLIIKTVELVQMGHSGYSSNNRIV